MPFLLYESEAVTSSVKSVSDLAVPDQTHFVLIQAETDAVRFTLDGSTPSATKGYRLIAGENPVEVEISRFKSLKFVRETNDAVLHLHYYAGRSIESEESS